MNSIIEARELTLKYLEPVLKKHGFTVKLSASKQARIERKSANGLDIIGFDMLNYNPSFRIMYALSKTNVRVNAILLRLQERVRLPLEVDKRTPFISFSYNTLHNPTRTVYLPSMVTEEEVQKCVAMMASFIEDPGMPLLARFDDLKEVDRIINGEDPWETDWLKPYPLGWTFYLSRLIISKLAGLGSYNRILSFVNDYYTSFFDDPENGKGAKARMAEIEQLDKMLKDEKSLA